MTQDIPKSRNANGITAAEVAEYLGQNPNFFIQHPETLVNQLPPGRDLGDGVVDFQSALIGRLREDVAGHTDRQRELLDTSRANLTIQTRVHECVLAMLNARSFEKVIEAIATDFTVLLDLDVTALCIEAQDGGWSGGAAAQGLRVISSGVVDALLGVNEDTILRGHMTGDPKVYGEAAGLVRSEALVRLQISPATPPAMLAFGSRDPEKFHPGQAVELMAFLAAALESVVRGWLTLPD